MRKKVSIQPKDAQLAIISWKWLALKAQTKAEKRDSTSPSSLLDPVILRKSKLNLRLLQGRSSLLVFELLEDGILEQLFGCRPKTRIGEGHQFEDPVQVSRVDSRYVGSTPFVEIINFFQYLSRVVQRADVVKGPANRPWVHGMLSLSRNISTLHPPVAHKTYQMSYLRPMRLLYWCSGHLYQVSSISIVSYSDSKMALEAGMNTFIWSPTNENTLQSISIDR